MSFCALPCLSRLLSTMRQSLCAPPSSALAVICTVRTRGPPLGASSVAARMSCGTELAPSLPDHTVTHRSPINRQLIGPSSLVLLFHSFIAAVCLVSPSHGHVRPLPLLVAVSVLSAVPHTRAVHLTLSLVQSCFAPTGLVPPLCVSSVVNHRPALLEVGSFSHTVLHSFIRCTITLNR